MQIYIAGILFSLVSTGIIRLHEVFNSAEERFLSDIHIVNEPEDYSGVDGHIEPIWSERPYPLTNWEYPTPAPDSLQRVSGFSFCSHLNGSVFDTEARMKAYLIDAVLSENTTFLLEQKKLHEPLWLYRLVFGQDTEFNIFGAEVPSITIREVGMRKFTRIVDSIAETLFHHGANKFKLKPIESTNVFDALVRWPVDSDEARRFSCFVAADGQNEWVKLTTKKSKLLRFVEGTTYFNNEIKYEPLDMKTVNKEANYMSAQWWGGDVSDKIVAAESSGDQEVNFQSETADNYYLFRQQLIENDLNEEKPKDSSISTKRHKIAYFVMVHKQIENVVNLLSSLLDPYVTILIHVDGKSPQLKRQLLKYLAEESEKNHLYHRVKIMKRSFRNAWGHSSLIYMQLAGFFELLGMSKDWEYVVNLSGNDYPLRMNDVLYQDLKSYGSASFIDYWNDEGTYERTNQAPNMLSKDLISGLPQDIDEELEEEQPMETRLKMKLKTQLLQTNVLNNMSFPFSHWQIYKHHQWIILHRSAVKQLRTSPTAIYLAAYMEWTSIPDESYFATFLANTPVGRKPIVKDAKRYLEFLPGALHPRWLGVDDLGLLVDCVNRGDSFIRKIDVNRNDTKQLVAGIRKIREWDWHVKFG